MKTYYIYHIPTIKIGCTVNINHRMKEQGFTDWEILEEHTDIYVASEREIELQKEYGYPVDKNPYWQSVEKRPKWDSETGKEARRNSPRGFEQRKLTFEQAEQIRSEYKNHGNLSSKTKTGLSQNELAVKYNVSRGIIAGVVRNQTYLTP
jgi:hypothetical protein